jgi:hypothetical protein
MNFLSFTYTFPKSVHRLLQKCPLSIGFYVQPWYIYSKCCIGTFVHVQLWETTLGSNLSNLGTEQATNEARCLSTNLAKQRAF